MKYDPNFRDEDLYDDLAASIINGGLTNDELRRLSFVIRDKMKANRELQAIQVKASLTVGDEVVLNGIKPKYLDGSTGRVTRIKQTRVDVTLDVNGVSYSVPLSCVSKKG